MSVLRGFSIVAPDQPLDDAVTLYLAGALAAPRGGGERKNNPLVGGMVLGFPNSSWKINQFSDL